MKKLHIIISLMIWFSVSLSAETNSSVGVSEEIGIPYIPTQEGRIDSAVFAPDGNSIYTLKDGLITYLQINPFKRLDMFDTKIKWNIQTPWVIRTLKLFVTKDNSRLIIFDAYQMALFDLEKKKIIRHITLSLDRRKLYLGVLKNNEFITVSSDLLKKGYELTRWDIDNFTKIDKHYFKRFGPNFTDEGDNECTLSICNALSISDKLIFITGVISDCAPYTAIVMNSKNFEVLKRKITSPFYFSKNKNFIKCEIFNKKTSTYEKGIYNIQNDSIESNKKLFSSKSNPIKCQKIEPRTDKYGLRFWGNFFYSLGERKKKSRIHQFENGKSIMIRKGYFLATDNLENYLSMKTEDGRVVPIDKKTYKKYNIKGVKSEQNRIFGIY